MPDLSGTRKTVSRPTPKYGETVTYTLALRNSGAPLTTTVYLTDTIPAGLDYVPGSLKATLGNTDDSQAPELHWVGVPGGTAEVTITYAVTVTQSDPATLVNTATFQAGIVTVQPSATIIVNARTIYSPVILKAK